MSFTSLCKQLFLILIVLFFLSACFHDEATEVDEHHDPVTTIDIHDEEVIDISSRKENTTGTAILTFHEEEKKITGSVTFSGTADTVQPMTLHIHAGYAGQSGDAVITLTDENSDGTWIIPEAEEKLTTEQVDILEAGGFYLNAHYENSETIRGQIITHNTTFVVTDLTPVAGVTSIGAGFAAITVNTSTRAITTYVTITGLTTVNSVHLHYDKEDNTTNKFPKVSMTKLDIDGKVIYSNVDTMTDNDDISAEDLEEAEAGLWYFNIHTDENATGELRGDFEVFSTQTDDHS